ncbi:LPXTG cell wall anchor domain-containing protein [Micromonospora sp. NPDC050187]|uniref:DUF7507 domain-containing protein n=1 Tax=Micromonospora sp. NPDC050187 TaxID=3364277 RepID=UPI003798AF9F
MSRTSTPQRRVSIRAGLAALGLLSGTLLLVEGSPALAASTIGIDPGDVPTTAAQVTQDCAPSLGGGPRPNEDAWVFSPPGNRWTSGTFQSVTATFSTPDGAVTRSIPTDPNSAITSHTGTSRAWIRTPAGWTLTGASAVVSGTAEAFVLAHACVASKPPWNGHPKLRLTTTGTPASGLQVGKKVVYRHTVTNETTGTDDPHPHSNGGYDAITHIAVSDDTRGHITCRRTSLRPGQSTTCTGTYTVTWQDVEKGKIVNSAQATGSFHGRPVHSNRATAVVTTEEVQASLSIDTKARIESDCRYTCENDGLATLDDRIFYTYRVANTGTVKITDVAVDDPSAGPVVCNSTTLAPGTSTDCHARDPYVVTEHDVEKGKIVNTAKATGRYGSHSDHDDHDRWDGHLVESDPVTVTVCIRDGKYDPGKDDDDHGDGDDDGKGGDDGKGELPLTGHDSAGPLALGGGLLAAGSLLLGAARIRRRAYIHI